jgi:hypothetical protein
MGRARKAHELALRALLAGTVILLIAHAVAADDGQIFPTVPPGRFWVDAPSSYDLDLNQRWQTKSGALLCPTYSSLKEGQAAAKVRDDIWLSKTGCTIAIGHLRVVLIDAPRLREGSLPWYGRIYMQDGQTATNAYFDQWDILTFATPLGGNNKPYLYSSQKEIEVDIKKNFDWIGFKRDAVPYRILRKGEKFELWFGPATYPALSLLCSYETKCTIIGNFP